MKKNRPLFALLLAALLVTLFAGCSPAALENRNDALEDVIADGPSSPPKPAETKLTPAEAEAIALAHAGLTADAVTRLRTEYEIDDGVPRYDVQFHYDKLEYDYDIHANTGAILSFDRDRD